MRLSSVNRGESRKSLITDLAWIPDFVGSNFFKHRVNIMENQNEQRLEMVWKALPNFDKDCFACGFENHSGLHMTFATNGEQLRTKLIVSPQFRGWSKLVHGGVISTILDETMSWTAIMLTKRFILTKKMTIEFLRPVYIDSPLCAVGYIRKRNGERSAIVAGELFDEQERLCATSEGEFVLFSKERFAKLEILPAEDLSAMAASFAGVAGEGGAIS